MTQANQFDMDDLSVRIRREGAAAVLETEGEITVFSSPELRGHIRAAAAGADRLVIDLSGTPYVDSSGVATLVEGLQIVQAEGGTMVLAGMSDRVRGVFEIARLDTVFEVADTVEEALRT